MDFTSRHSTIEILHQIHQLLPVDFLPGHLSLPHLIQHLRAAEFALQVAELSTAQRLVLQKVITQLGPDGLDWHSAMKRELELLRGVNSEAMAQIIPSYLSALNNASQLPGLQRMIATAPHPIPEVIPNPKRVLEQKQNLTDKLLQARSRLQ